MAPRIRRSAAQSDLVLEAPAPTSKLPAPVVAPPAEEPASTGITDGPYPEHLPNPMLPGYLIAMAMTAEPSGVPMVFERPYFDQAAYAAGGSGIMGRCYVCGEHTLREWIVTAQCEPRDRDGEWHPLCEVCAPRRRAEAIRASAHPHHRMMLRWAGYRFGVGGFFQVEGGPGEPAVVTRWHPGTWPVVAPVRPRRGVMARGELVELLLLASRVLDAAEPSAGTLAGQAARWVASGAPGTALRETAAPYRERELRRARWVSRFRRRPREWRRGVLFVCALLDAVEDDGAPPFSIPRRGLERLATPGPWRPATHLTWGGRYEIRRSDEGWDVREVGADEPATRHVGDGYVRAEFKVLDGCPLT